MRIWRSSMYYPGHPPLTTVIRECDLRDTIESIIAGQEPPGVLILNEIFTMPDDVTIEDASFEGVRRQQANAEREANQMILYYWAIKSWQILKAGGMLMMDKPAPLTREEIAVVLVQLGQHPEYDNYQIVSHTEQGVPVVFANGRLEEE